MACNVFQEGFFLLLAVFCLSFSFSKAQMVPAVFMFGDSLVDVGNNNYLLLSIAQANYPHNGVDFPTKRPTGRFSNGKNSAGFLAEKVGLPTSPPYLSLRNNKNKTSVFMDGAGIFNFTNQILEGYAFEELIESYTESYLTHTFEVSSLFASSVCNHSTKANERESTFRVVDKYSPCFQPSLHRSPPSLTDIIRSDRARIYSIQARLSKDPGRRDLIVEPNSLRIPVIDGSAFDTLSYLVTVGLGTPKKDLSLVLDTGSRLTWTQCEPCRLCYKQSEPLFDRDDSGSYVSIPRTDPVCAYVRRPVDPPRPTNLCSYEISYGDGSISVGFFSKETLTMSAAEKINSFLFGCGTENTGPFNLEAGVLGLNQEDASIVVQTAQKYKKIFSYCLPSSTSSTGHLTFGSQTPAPADIKYTKLVAEKSPYYGLDLIGIGLGGTKLDIAESIFTTPGTIIDSGAVFTYLPPDAYTTFRDAFRVKMSAYPLIPGPTAAIETCYDFSKSTSVTVPEISFFFKDGTVVGMPGKSSLIAYSSTLTCLGFQKYKEGDKQSIIGNKVQRTMEVVYDVAGQRVGFAPNGCS